MLDHPDKIWCMNVHLKVLLCSHFSGASLGTTAAIAISITGFVIGAAAVAPLVLLLTRPGVCAIKPSKVNPVENDKATTSGTAWDMDMEIWKHPDEMFVWNYPLMENERGIMDQIGCQLQLLKLGQVCCNSLKSMTQMKICKEYSCSVHLI